MTPDARWMAAAIALSSRGRARSWPNPNVGCIIVRDAIVVGRGVTGDGGRPHAEAEAIAEAGAAARGATAYVTLEPCAHESPRGPACADALIAAGVARVVLALRDPDPRTDGAGAARLAAAGIAVSEGVEAAAAASAMAGWWTRRTRGRPFVTLKLALSLDGSLALNDGQSRWITGPVARSHAHAHRARVGAIVVGRRTVEIDAPALDVRLPGLTDRAPLRVVLTRRSAPTGWTAIASPADVATLATDDVLVEGGGATAAAFLRADLIDRLHLYRAPILLGGQAGLADYGLADLASAHGQWRLVDARDLGQDRFEEYGRG